MAVLTVDEVTHLLKNAAYLGYNVNKLACEVAKKGIEKLAYDAISNQVYIHDGGRRIHKVELNKIYGKDHSWSLIRFFKMYVFCFDRAKYDDRMNLLATGLYNKIQNAEKEAQRSLSMKDFSLMQTVLEKQGDEAMVSLYENEADDPQEILWMELNKNSQAIEIKDALDSSKQLILQMNKSVTCLMDRKAIDLDKIPQDRSNWLTACLKKTIELSSQYEFDKTQVKIKVIKRWIEKNPEAHLSLLSNILKKAVTVEPHPRLDVILLKDNLEKGDGLDNGGLSRDYMNTLFASFIENSNSLFKTGKPLQLFMPVTKLKGFLSEDLATLFPGLTSSDHRSLNEMGSLMMFCYNSIPNTDDIKNNSYAIGQHFDDLLFELALTLNAKEVNTSFRQLGLDVRVRLARCIAQKFLEASKADSTWIENKLALFDLYLWHGPSLDGYNLEAANQFASGFIDQKDGFSLDMLAVNKNPQGFVNVVCENLLNDKFGEVSIAELIAPIHAVAQGLKSMCKSDQDWDNTITNVSARDFNTKIQGNLDRNTIIAALKVETKMHKDDYLVERPFEEIQELHKKRGWIVNWIRNPNTQDEYIRRFLIYTTGLNSLQKNETIFIRGEVATLHPDTKKIIYNDDGSLYYSPIPRGDMCNKTLYISAKPSGNEVVNDWTEVEFLKVFNGNFNTGKFEINKD